MRVKDDWRNKVKEDMVAVCSQRLKVGEGKSGLFHTRTKCVAADILSVF